MLKLWGTLTFPNIKGPKSTYIKVTISFSWESSLLSVSVVDEVFGLKKKKKKLNKIPDDSRECLWEI